VDLAAGVVLKVADATALKHASSIDAELETMEPAKPSGGGGGKKASKSTESTMSDGQKLAVGLMGELWAREWLRVCHGLESISLPAPAR
jgi:hypothetical protein